MTYIITLTKTITFAQWGPEGEELPDTKYGAGTVVELIDMDEPDEDYPSLTICPLGKPNEVINVFLSDIEMTELF